MRQAVVVLAASLAALPAAAQVQQDEVAQLRTLLRQQAAAMQTMQRRLDALEARQRRTVAAPASRSGPDVAAQADAVPTPDRGETRSVEGGALQGRRSTQQQAAQGGGAGVQPAVPGTRPENQPTPPGTGTVEATPRQEAVRTGQVAAPASGNPPLPVLSGNDRVQVTLSGQVNRLVLAYGDGSGRTDTYFADNNVSSTRIRALGSARLDNVTTAVSAIEFDLRSNSSVAVNRQSSNGNGGDTPALGPFRVRRAELGIQSAYGSLLLGRGSSFGDGIAEFDLSGTDVALYSQLADTAGALQFSNSAGARRRAGDPLIGQVFDDFDGVRDDRIRYDSPAWNGLSAGVSVGQGGSVDVGLRYAGILSGARIAAGVAYLNIQSTLPSTQPQNGIVPATSPFAQRVVGSFATLLPNGFNLLVSAGWGEHYGGCCTTTLIAQDNSVTYFVKAGYQARIFGFGPSNFAVQGGQTFNRIRDGDVASRYGFSFNQQVVARGFEVYAGYERLTLRRSGAASYAPADVGLIGSRLQF